MEVLKFGGTSVGSAYGLRCIKSLVESKKGTVILVVSALGGATDQLIKTSQIAAENGDFKTELNSLRNRHFQAITDSVNKQHQENTRTQINSVLNELETILNSVAILQEISEKTSDLIVSYGERLSAPIVTGIFENAHMLNALDIFVTKHYFDKHIIDFVTTNKNIESTMISNKINVCSGFISKDQEGKRITNLGRGGSDYTAAILASALNASVLEIYTDVDGFLTSDPRVVEKASLIQELDFFDAIELCNYGAKVIYSPTIFPAFHKGIEIKIRNTFNQLCIGSSIITSKKNDHITGISSINDLSLIRIVGNLNGLRYRLYKVLSSVGIEVFFGAKDNFGIHFKDVNRTVDILENEFSQELAMGRIDKVEVTNNLAMVAIVGSFSDQVGLKAQIVTLLEESGIDIIAFGEDCSKRVITYVVKIENVRGAIITTHNLIGLQPPPQTKKQGDFIGIILEKLKQAGDIIHNIENKGEYTFVTTNRYREYPLRIKN